MEQIIDEVKSYIVYIEDNGYYADKQIGNKLNFTDNYQYAKKYKTKKGALNCIKQSSESSLYKGKKSYIQPLKIKQISEFILDRMEDIKIEEEINTEFRFTDAVYKKTIVSDKYDDFWN